MHFIQQALNQSVDLPGALNEEAKNDYSNYSENFHQLYTDLLNELKENAFQKKANALLDVNFGLTPLLTPHHHSQNKYQITCTATLAYVVEENNEESNEI